MALAGVHLTLLGLCARIFSALLPEVALHRSEMVPMDFLHPSA